MKSDLLVYYGAATAIALIVGAVAGTGVLGGNPRYWPLTIIGLIWLAAAWRLGFGLAHVPLNWHTWRNRQPALVSLVIFAVVAWGAGLLLQFFGILK